MDPTRSELDRQDFAAHHAWLLRLARRLAADEGEAEDLVQDAWAEILRRGSAAARDLRAYLAGIVRLRAARERAADRARGSRELCAARAEELPSAAVLVERLELARGLAAELARLPEEQRTLLLLHHQEGVALATIARRRGVPAGTVRAQITRARQALRARLDRRFGKREEWAAVALAAPRSGSPSAPLAPLVGGIAMNLALKIGLGAGAVVLMGWLLWRSGAQAEGTLARAGSAAAAQRLDPAATRGTGTERARGTGADPEQRNPVGAGEPTPAAPDLRLRILDAELHTPLASYDLSVRHASAGATEDGEVVTTDAHGELVLDARRFAAPLEIRALDDAQQAIDLQQVRRIERDALPADGTPLVLEFLAGPSYTLAFDAPPPAEVEVSLAPGRAPDLDGRGRRLRPGPLPWVRLDPVEANASVLGDGPWTLTARARDGCWLALGEAQQRAGVQDEPVVMSASPRGTIRVHATIGGAPIQTTLGASVYPLVEGRTVASGQRHATLYPEKQRSLYGDHGRGELRFLEPRSYRVFVGAQDYPAQHADVEVRAGETTSIELDLEPRADLCALDVIARSETGHTRFMGLRFVAHGPDGGAETRWASWIETRADGSALYRFDALARGEWELALDPTPELPPWRATSVRAQAGGAPVEFLCLDHDAPPAVRRRVRVVEAASGAPIPFAGVTTLLDHRLHFQSTTDAAGETWIGPYLSGQELEVHARAGGHAAALVALRMGASDEPLEIALEPGWGALILVVEPDTSGHGSPLADVVVRLDGVLAGTTDAHGHLFVSSAQRPARIDFERAGYRLDYGNVDETSGAPNAQELGPLWILLRRAP